MIEITCTLPQTIVRVRLFRACFGILPAETYGILISSHTSGAAGPDQGPRSGVATGRAEMCFLGLSVGDFKVSDDDSMISAADP